MSKWTDNQCLFCKIDNDHMSEGLKRMSYLVVAGFCAERKQHPSEFSNSCREHGLVALNSGLEVARVLGCGDALLGKLKADVDQKLAEAVPADCEGSA